MTEARKLVSASVVAKELGLSAVRIRQLAEAGLLPATRTPGGHRRFDLAEVRSAIASRKDWLIDSTMPLAGLAEDAVWHELLATLPILGDEARRIAAYAFTEMLNNAIDHSQGTSVRVRVWDDGDALSFEIADDGVGVFAHVQRSFALPDLFASVAELTKGKRTSAADQHSGEGIFFTSKAVDDFQLSSNGVLWRVDNVVEDQAVGESSVTKGTVVQFTVQSKISRSLSDVFRAFSREHEFNRSQPVIKLFEIGTEFVSRSEAKRLLEGMDSFEEITLDFRDVALVGQGFVDEVFRVWAKAHPDILLHPINMNEAVEFMVDRGLPRD